LSPKGEFWNRLERALDLSKNVSEPAKNDLGNSPLSFDPTRTIPKPLKQHPIQKKIIQSAIFKDLGEKLPEPSRN
jgi:hypothetical protein